MKQERYPFWKDQLCIYCPIRTSETKFFYRLAYTLHKIKKNPLFYLTFPYISRPLSISTNFCYCHIYQYLHMSFTKFEQNIFIGFRKIQIKWSAVGANFKHKIIGKFHNIYISSFFKTVLFSSKDRYSHQTTCAVFFQPCCSYTIGRKKSILFHTVYIILFQEAQKGF